MLGPRIPTLDTRTVKPLEKQADAHYQTSEHAAWARQVKERAGWRCQWEDASGNRCERSRARGDMMYADHIEEIKDRPDLKLDPRNGRCLCNSHNTKKGIEARAARMSRT